MSDRPHQRTIKHFDEPGDAHELTFTCYQRLPLLTNDAWRRLLCRSIDAAATRHQFSVAAFVIMPEHVHLLVLPCQADCRIAALLYGIKRPYSYRVKAILEEQHSPLLEKLTVYERRKNKRTFRYWQKGPGYDRNLNTLEAVLSAIDYLHLNPVRRGLCERASDWKWSSARWYACGGQEADPDLPRVDGVPAQWLDDLTAQGQ
jgi:putative transposase